MSGITIAQNANSESEKINITKGTWSFGGSASFGYADQEFENFGNTFESNFLSFSIIPEIGYAVEENLILGLGLGYSYRRSEDNDSNIDFSNDTFIIAPFIKRFFPINDNLLFTLKGEFRYTKANADNFSNGNNITTQGSNTYFVGIRPGISFFISEKVALEANFGSLGYERTTSETNNNPSTFTINNFGFDFNSANLLFGFTYYMN